jgi:Zn-dependent peptidase ImmA (M78 family)
VGKAVEVPITPSVLDWALAESGFSDKAIAEELSASVEDITAWKDGTAKPSLTQFRKLAGKLHRPLATFLLPEPPKKKQIRVEFRDISGRERRSLSPTERRYMRRAHRIQEVLGWIARELDQQGASLKRHTLSDSPELSAGEVRSTLSVTVEQQQDWHSASRAFDEWRSRVEALGVAVFLYALGEKSVRGFSIWHDVAPVIAVNTAWREEARIYTLFHELGHLATRTNSACAEWRGGTHNRSTDPAERWCEHFAAALLMPRAAVERVLPASVRRGHVQELGFASSLATRFRVSLRAATIRLIELNFATWELYDRIPPAADSKRGGGGGTGRNRLEIRADEFGQRGTSLFVEAVKKDLLSRSQAVEYLDIPDRAFDQLAGDAS